MIRTLSVVAAIMLGATAVVAQQNPILVRQEAMKKINDETKTLSGMAKGDIPYDTAKVNAILSGWEEITKKLPSLFPDDSKTGERTRAKADIWQNKADFEAKIADFAKVIAATKAKAASADGFKAAFPELTKSCDNCHEKYRGPRPPA